MLHMLRRLLLYSVISLVGSITSLFSSKKELGIVLLLLLVIGGWLFMTQDTKNKKLLEQAGVGDEETVTQTVQDGAWIMATDEFGRTALHIAARYSNVETVRALLQMQAPVDARDFRQRTPLHMTRYDGGSNTQIVELLLQYNADPEAEDYKGRTPIDILQRQPRYNKPAEALLKEALRRKHEAEVKNAPPPSFLPEPWADDKVQ